MEAAKPILVQALHYWKPSDPDWHLVAVPNRPWTKLRVKAVEQEPTCYFVESESLHCPTCKKQLDGKFAARHRLVAGDQCPNVERNYVCSGILETYFYRVDLSGYKMHGECSCPHFTGRLAKELQKDRPDSWILGQHQCKHVQAAIALNSLIYTELMERERYKNQSHRRRQEGAGA